ncbi:ScbA/BarX family gamma-butyrolactone biosynthesis protein [Streptomyces sp. 2A115]|uniref:ScbA/BarX family gamma-butyrolactone biosynthesis protein n=1 Tax=Streptomyces sp. 2A115 TaxID=3457439 RepID=UPI003FD1F2F1
MTQTSLASGLAHPWAPDAGAATLGLVHRVRASDAFPVSWIRTGQDRFSVAVRLPHDHPFYAPVRGGHDPVLIAETLRQAVALVSHAAYEVPLDHAFSLTSMKYVCVPERLGVGDWPVAVDIDVHCTEVVRRRGNLAQLEVELAIRHVGQVVATGAISVRIVTAAVYRRLRGGRTEPVSSPLPLAPPVPAGLVGRERTDDVLLAATGHRRTWELRADTSHPTLFQGPKDHVPGMLLLEAARQAAHAVTRSASFVPYEAEVVFGGYVEFGVPCRLEAHPLPELSEAGPAVRVTGLQEGRAVFHADLRDRTAALGSGS